MAYAMTEFGSIIDQKKNDKKLKEYIEDSYAQLHARKLKDVYITDHKQRDKKYNTISEEEDFEFFKISKAIENYGKGVKAP